jgi:hypothetical protein
MQNQSPCPPTRALNLTQVEAESMISPWTVSGHDYEVVHETRHDQWGMTLLPVAASDVPSDCFSVRAV